jgi:hypothetical protein
MTLFDYAAIAALIFLIVAAVGLLRGKRSEL